MYMELSGARYRCTGAPTLTGDTLRLVLPDGGPELAVAPAGTVKLCREDGFEIWSGDLGGRLRWYYEGDALVITDLPEPAPVPTPEPMPTPEPTPQEDTDALLVEHEYRLTMIELGVNENAV